MQIRRGASGCIILIFVCNTHGLNTFPSQPTQVSTNSKSNIDDTGQNTDWWRQEWKGEALWLAGLKPECVRRFGSLVRRENEDREMS